VPSFRGKLKPAGGGHCDTSRLPDYRAKPTMPQAIFHQGEQFGVVMRLRIQHTSWVQSRLKQRRSEQIPRAYHPQNRALGTSRDSSQKQGGGSIVTPIAAFPCHLVQRVPAQPPIGKPPVEKLDSERQHRTRHFNTAFDSADHGPQFGQG